MKKTLAILGVLVLVAAAACGSYYFGLSRGQGGEDPPETEPQTVDETQQQATDETQPPMDEMIVGLWQNGPSVGAGIGECYRFYADGTYTFDPGSFVLDPLEYRAPRSEGAYEADKDSVTLRRRTKTVVEGGAWVEDPIAGYTLEGGTEKTVAASKMIFTIYLGVFRELDREMLSIDGRTYWKISGDPDAYLPE